MKEVTNERNRRGRLVQHDTSRQTAQAFTAVELAVVVAVLGMLCAMLLPTMAKTGLNTKAFQCLNNNRQLCNAWRMYADDGRDWIVYSSDDGSSSLANQYAWTWSHMDYNPNNRNNWDTNADIVMRPLWLYTGRNASIYKCPSDQSLIVVNGTARPRVRSMSMNFWLGGMAGTDGGLPFASVNRIFLKTTDMIAPGPAKTFVFLDMRPDAINWGNFFTDMTGYPSNSSLYEFQDLPGMFHDFASSFSFADGHAEIHRWVDPRTTPPVVSLPAASPNNPDIAWLQDHSTRPK